MNTLKILARIADRLCAIPASDVQSVIELGEVTPIPRTPDFLVGMTGLRSQALTVIDARLALGKASDDFETDHRAAVVDVGGHSYALIVDQIMDVCETDQDCQQVSGGFGETWDHAVKGMIETDHGPAMLIDVAALTKNRGSARKAA
jgi:purine-binding chemotaxis protein CheW